MDSNNCLLFFDAFTQIGPRRTKHACEAWKLSELLDEMEHCSISGALVASTMSVTYDLMYSNLKLSETIKSHEYLFPIWNVMPHQTMEFPEPDELENLMKKHDVRAVTIYPKSNGWDLRADSTQILIKWLEKQKVLTILNRDEFACYNDLDRFLSCYSNLHLLLTGASFGEQRFLIPLIQKHKNLHITFDKFQIHYGIEYLHSIGGDEQMVYASNALAMSMGAHRTYIDYADVPVNVRSKIAGGNLIRLLKGQKPPNNRNNENEDVIMKAVRQGRPVTVPVIDMHMHMLHENLNGAGGSHRIYKGGPKGVFSLLNRIGCQGGGLMSWSGVASGDSLNGNECVRQALDMAPKGYWGLATFDPVHYSKSELGRMIPKVYSDKRFIGMKPYLYGVEYHDAMYDIWWKFGNQNSFYALIDMDQTGHILMTIDTLAAKYPNVRWVVAHCGMNYNRANVVIEAIKKHPNVYAEITRTSVTFGIIDYLVEHAGEDRIIYGSDLPMRDPRQQLGWVVFSKLSFDAKKKVLGGNALSVIKPCRSRLPHYNHPDMVTFSGEKRYGARSESSGS